MAKWATRRTAGSVNLRRVDRDGVGGGRKRTVEEVVHGGKSFFSPLSNDKAGEQECPHRDSPQCLSGSKLIKPAVGLVHDGMRAEGGRGAIAAGDGTGDAAAVGGAA